VFEKKNSRGPREIKKTKLRQILPRVSSSSTHLHVVSVVVSAILHVCVVVMAVAAIFATLVPLVALLALVFGIFVDHLAFDLALARVAAAVSTVAFASDADSSEEACFGFFYNLVQVDFVLAPVDLAAVVDDFLCARIGGPFAAVYRVDAEVALAVVEVGRCWVDDIRDDVHNEDIATAGVVVGVSARAY